MASLDSLVPQLQAAVDAGNIEQGKQILRQVKVAILSAPESAAVQAATALELGVLLSVADADLTSLSRNMAMLLPRYTHGVTTPQKNHILGLHLMHLLVEHQLSEFHSLLEVISEQDASSPFISFPIGIERQMMVGMYDEVLTKNIPHPSYQFFLDHLQQTVRDSIADGIEVAYESLALTDAAKMMKFSSVDELNSYIQEFRDDWIIEGDRLTFQPATTTLQASDIAAKDWIKQSLQYATELERII
jgi:26S proteasome regulatory subunit N12